MGANAGDGYAIESVENALRTLLLLQDNPSFRAIDVAGELGVARSTAHRMVATLEKHDFIRRNPDKSYSAGHQLVELGLSVVGGPDFATEIQPLLARIAGSAGETTHFLVRDGRDVLFAAGAEGAHRIRAVLRTGERAPAHTTAAGRMLLASLDDATLAGLYGDGGLSGGTELAIGTLTELREDLAEVRGQGYAVNSSQSEEGLLAVARLVTDSRGRVRGAVSVSGPQWRLEPRVAELADLLAALLPAAG